MWFEMTSDRSADAIARVLLHNPGCNDPDEICSPHPTGILDTFETALNNPELLLVPLVLIALATVAGVARRKYDER